MKEENVKYKDIIENIDEHIDAKIHDTLSKGNDNLDYLFLWKCDFVCLINIFIFCWTLNFWTHCVSFFDGEQNNNKLLNYLTIIIQSWMNLNRNIYKDNQQ